MKLDKETVLELMNEAASYHGPMISVSKERIIDLCDTALYAVAPVPEGGDRDAIIEECAKAIEPRNGRGCDCERCDCGNSGDANRVAQWDADMASARTIRALKRHQPQNGEGSK